jgi:uncharacterized protein
MARNPFVVQLSSLEGGPGERKPLVVSGPLDQIETSVVHVGADAPVTFDGTVDWVEGTKVALTGTVSVPWTAECRRCLGEAAGMVVADVREIFEPQPVEGETYELKGDVVDLEPMLREAIVLEFPMAPVVCKDDCAGLCPQCGINKNEESCNCDTTPKDPRWAALEGVKFDEGSDD